MYQLCLWKLQLKKVVHFDWSKKVQNVDQKSTKRIISFTEIEKSIVHFDWSKKVQNVDQKSAKTKISFTEIEKSSSFWLVGKGTKRAPKKYMKGNIFY